LSPARRRHSRRLQPPSNLLDGVFRDQQIAFGKRMLVLRTDSQIPRTSSEHGGAHGAVCYRAATLFLASNVILPRQSATAQQHSPQRHMLPARSSSLRKRHAPLAQEQIQAQTRFLGPPQDRGPGAAGRPDGAETILALKGHDSGPTHPQRVGAIWSFFAISPDKSRSARGGSMPLMRTVPLPGHCRGWLWRRSRSDWKSMYPDRIALMASMACSSRSITTR
jgi:hypothetical protein